MILIRVLFFIAMSQGFQVCLEAARLFVRCFVSLGQSTMIKYTDALIVTAGCLHASDADFIQLIEEC